MKYTSMLATFLSFFFSFTNYSHADTPPTDSSRIARGRYLVAITGCNDCHTSGYAPSNGTVQEEQWLTGDSVGWRGPWGTTYPINLRTFTSKLTEEQWLAYARSAKPRPPMPWWVLHRMEEQDLRDIYLFIRSLPVKGKEVPAYLPPDKLPETPYFTVMRPQVVNTPE